VDPYERAAGYSGRIEQELRNLNVWQTEPLPDAAYESDQAFFLDTMTFYQWLQFVLVPRVEEIIAQRGSFPEESSVGAHAVRELDGVYEAADLITALIDFDEFIESLQRRPNKDRGKGKTAPAAPVVSTQLVVASIPTESPLLVTEHYWRTRDQRLLHSRPHSMPGQDVQLAEQVFATATGFIEFVGEVREIADGMEVTAVIEADRGSWVVVTVLSKDQDRWRVDIPLSLGRTTGMFLQHHQIHPPFTENDDARGRAMQFWQHVSNRNDRWAKELVVPESAEIPHFGEGQIDELFWYVGHAEENGTATVRVLMNNHLECRTWLTRMVQRDGKWFVDLPATLAGGSGIL